MNIIHIIMHILLGLLRTLESPLLLVRCSIGNHEGQQQQVYGCLSEYVGTVVSVCFFPLLQRLGI